MAKARLSEHLIEAFTQASDHPARISQDAIEVLVARPTISSGSPTGAGLSQNTVEVFAQASDARVRVASACIEVFARDDSQDVAQSPAAATAWVMIG